MIVSPLAGEGGARLAYRRVEQALAETAVPIPLENISNQSSIQTGPTSESECSVGRNRTQNFGGLGLAGDAYIYIMN